MMYAYSFDTVSYFDGFISIEEALADACECGWDEECPKLWIGECHCTYTPHVDVRWLLEDLEMSAFQVCGECAEDWLWGVDKEALSALDKSINTVVREWLSKYGYEPTWFEVRNVQEYDYMDYKTEVKNGK